MPDKEVTDSEAQIDSNEPIGEEIDRRDFISKVAVGAACLTAVGTTGNLMLGYLSPPKQTLEGKEKTGWIPAGKVEDITEEPTKVDYGGDYAVYVFKKEGHVLALSAVCPHLGCTIFWRPEVEDPKEKHALEKCENEYFCCPCHLSEYDPLGKVLRGPAAPNNMIAQKIEIKDGVVMLGGVADEATKERKLSDWPKA